MKPHHRLAIIPVLLLLLSCKQHHPIIVNGLSTWVIEGRSYVIEPQPPPGISCDKEVSLKEWFVHICETEKPDKEDSIPKYRFVLYDNGPCYLICLLNRKDYPQGDSMPTNTNRSIPPPVFRSLSKTAYKGLDWERVIEKVGSQLDELIMLPEYRNSALSNAKSISISFDNESLVRLQQPHINK